MKLASASGAEGEAMKVIVTIRREFDFGPDSIYGTEEDYRDVRELGDLHEVIGDDLHEAVQDEANWIIEEKP